MAGRKEIYLQNYGLTVRPDKQGMFEAVLYGHNATHEWEEGVDSIVLTELTVFEGLYDALSLYLVPLDDELSSSDIVNIMTKFRLDLMGLDSGVG